MHFYPYPFYRPEFIWSIFSKGDVNYPLAYFLMFIVLMAGMLLFVGIGRLSYQNEICGLGSGLHSVYARENGGAGAVALENLPGRVHPEGGGDALAGYQLVDLVDQQHASLADCTASAVGAGTGPFVKV